MKAKEYYEKHKAGLVNADKETALTATLNLIHELMNEVETVVKARHVKYDKGFIPILREQNDKYKAIVRMFEKEYGVAPIRMDGFELVLENRVPGVVELMKGRSASRKVDTHTREGVSDA